MRIYLYPFISSDCFVSIDWKQCDHGQRKISYYIRFCFNYIQAWLGNLYIVYEWMKKERRPEKQSYITQMCNTHTHTHIFKYTKQYSILLLLFRPENGMIVKTQNYHWSLYICIMYIEEYIAVEWCCIEYTQYNFLVAFLNIGSKKKSHCER